MKVLIVATSRKTRGGITSVVKAHEQGKQWKEFKCKWIQTHRDGNCIRKLWYFISALILYLLYIPFYNVIHIHIATTQSAQRKRIFFYLAKLFKRKIILHFHPSNEKFLFEESNKKLYYNLFTKANIVLVLSEQWRRWIEDALGVVDGVKVIYNPCPTVVRKNNASRRNQILFAGSIIPRKGYDILLKAFAKIANNYPDWNLIFAGNGEVEKGKVIAKELGIYNQVKFIGWVKNKEKEIVFQESSIYCLASDGEGFPMGVLDAWAYGIPCVVTPVGGLPDIVVDHQNGLLFPVGDYERLAEALKELMDSSDLRTTIVKEADKYVYNLFNIEHINNELANIYRNI